MHDPSTRKPLTLHQVGKCFPLFVRAFVGNQAVEVIKIQHPVCDEAHSPVAVGSAFSQPDKDIVGFAIDGGHHGNLFVFLRGAVLVDADSVHPQIPCPAAFIDMLSDSLERGIPRDANGFSMCAHRPCKTFVNLIPIHKCIASRTRRGEPVRTWLSERSPRREQYAATIQKQYVQVRGHFELVFVILMQYRDIVGLLRLLFLPAP